jgi:hypothetical protein
MFHCFKGFRLWRLRGIQPAVSLADPLLVWVIFEIPSRRWRPFYREKGASQRIQYSTQRPFSQAAVNTSAEVFADIFKGPRSPAFG